YPYIGSRHTIFLAPFEIAAASFLVASLVRQKLWAGIAIAAVLVGICNASEDPSRARIMKENQRRELMTGAVTYAHRFIPSSELILVDQQSSFLMAYYLCGPDRTPQLGASLDEFFMFTCGGYSFAVFNLWKLRSENFVSAYDKIAHAYGLRPDSRVWVVQAGWGTNLDATLPLQFPKFRCIAPVTFGRNITVIPFVTGSDLLLTTASQTASLGN